MRPVGREPAAPGLDLGPDLSKVLISLSIHVIALPASSGARYRARGEMAFHELFDTSQQHLLGGRCLAPTALPERPNPPGVPTERIAVECRVGRRLFHCVAELGGGGGPIRPLCWLCLLRSPSALPGIEKILELSNEPNDGRLVMAL